MKNLRVILDVRVQVEDHDTPEQVLFAMRLRILQDQPGFVQPYKPTEDFQAISELGPGDEMALWPEDVGEIISRECIRLNVPDVKP